MWEIALTPATAQSAASRGTIALVGHSNVGKSALFQKLTGVRAMVSNYPGTTVEITRGALTGNHAITLLDTPGVITLPANSEDERITEKVLLAERLQSAVQVGDAKNLPRTLSLTLLLMELGLPMALVLNMMDEAIERGSSIDHALLGKILGIPVVPTAAVHGHGLDALPGAFLAAQRPKSALALPDKWEVALTAIESLMPETTVSRRGLALLFLAHDGVAEEYLVERMPFEQLAKAQDVRARLQGHSPESLASVLQSFRWQQAENITARVLQNAPAGRLVSRSRLAQLTVHPVWGLFLLALALVAVFWFVGVVGAQWLVGLLEVSLFGEIINPALASWVASFAGKGWLYDLLVGPYGLWTMGITYAVALILPIVTTFFLAFGVLEDSGYLPRLAVLSNRWFSWLGLNGKAVLPMVLGLGCVTMATVTTRTLETRRERFLVTLLLALAVPCSAQLGVVMGLLAGTSALAVLIWSFVILATLFAVGYLAARLSPGERQPLVLELPPFRWPLPGAILVKTAARLEWYMKEVLPLFLLGALVMFLLDRTGGLALLVRAAEPLTVGWLGLPAAAAPAFVLGFMRRDFGATGFFLLSASGVLSPTQTVVAMVTITLFIPCIATVMMIAKEYGNKIAVSMVALIFPLAFFVGGLLNHLLLWIGNI
ncbi:MAG: ferrous iron transport protein B [Anaerolineae bacterium]|nr:MAG: ferrous iron transport protein B [Anaerolineae bacterium]